MIAGMPALRALASSLGAWRHIEKQEQTRRQHGLVFSLAVVAEIGRDHGLELVAEEVATEPARAFDAVFISVLDSRCMLDTAACFRAWGIEMRRSRRGKFEPLVWAGGQGLHNPMPYYDVADLVVIGDAEDPLPELLRLWAGRRDRPGFLRDAAEVSGVWVPAHHGPGRTRIRQAVAADISITTRRHVSVSLHDVRRVEIARGCRYKCGFCSLGWRTPVRENSTDDVIRAIREGGRRVHLQAGDAESHSGIVEIRRALLEHGGHDQGWTGRVDTTEAHPDTIIPGQKRYAFGVEGVSYRLRRAVGKGHLTDARLVESTVEYLGRIERGSRGRSAWHLIAGLPGQRRGEHVELLGVITQIQRRYRGEGRALSLHVQPFQPLPSTPMQWFGCGSGAAALAKALRPMTGGMVSVRAHAGRTDDVAKICTVLTRSDQRGADLLEAVGAGLVEPERAAEIAGVGWGELDPDLPLPWDFVETHVPAGALRRARDVYLRRVA